VNVVVVASDATLVNVVPGVSEDMEVVAEDVLANVDVVVASVDALEVKVISGVSEDVKVEVVSVDEVDLCVGLGGEEVELI